MMTLTCTITTPSGVLSGRLEADYANSIAPVAWSGDAHLLHAQSLPGWLRETPEEMKPSTLEGYAEALANALHGTVEMTREGEMKAIDNFPRT